MNKQSIFAIALVLVLGVTGYLWYGYFQAAPADNASGQNQGSGFSSLARFQNIQLDISLFRDSFFNTLSPPQITPQPDITPGRPNPFAAFK